MDPWSVFWRQGHSTTFGDWFKQGYDGAVAAWWSSALDEAPEKAAVIELGCGNCSLLPAMVKSGLAGKYIGVDVARVSPSTVAAQGLADSGIELVLHSETPAEEVPETDACCDLAASVFGIEYSDLERSVPEAARLLKPGGRFFALLHHDNSIVTAMSKRAIDEFRQEDIQKAVAALSTISSERDRVRELSELKSSTKAEEARSLINSLAQKYLSDTNPKTANATMFEFMSQALRFFKMMGASSEQRVDFIQSLETEHTASHERFQQMVSVAFDDEGIDNLKTLFASSGFTEIAVGVVNTGDDILAWSLQAKKQ
jgi:SAM-dependent methyltransferase